MQLPIDECNCGEKVNVIGVIVNQEDPFYLSQFNWTFVFLGQSGGLVVKSVPGHKRKQELRKKWLDRTLPSPVPAGEGNVRSNNPIIKCDTT